MNARRSANATRPPSRAQAPPPRAPFALPFARIRRRPTGSTRLRCSRRCRSHASSPRRQAPRRSPASSAPPLPLLHLLSVERRPSRPSVVRFGRLRPSSRLICSKPRHRPSSSTSARPGVPRPLLHVPVVAPLGCACTSTPSSVACSPPSP